MSAATALDRSADRDDIAAKMDDFARNGGLIEKLDYAGNLVALVADQPKAARPMAKVLPMPKRDARPVVQLTPVEVIPEPEVTRRAKVLPFPTPKAPPSESVAEWCDRVAFAPTGKPPAPLAAEAKPPVFAPAGKPVDYTHALRCIRVEAERALARLNAAFPTPARIPGGEQVSLLIELPQYKRALRIAALIPNPRGVELHFDNTRYAPIQVGLQWVAKHMPEPGTYFVVMEDGRDGCMGADRFESECIALGGEA